MATLTSQLIKNYSLLGRLSAPVRSSASATSSLLRSIFAGMSAGTATGKIVVSGNDYWIEVSQTPFANGFVKSTDLRILNDKKTEVFLNITHSGGTSYKIAFTTTAPTPTTTTSTTQNVSESQAKSEIDQFVLNDQNVFASLGRSQSLLTKIPQSVNVTAQVNTINTLTARYNKRQNTLNNAKGFKAAVASFNLFKIIKTSKPNSSVNGLGAVPAILLVPVVKWGLVGVTALTIWLIVRSNKNEGLSDLKLSKDVEAILNSKLTPEETKKVINEFETQRKQAFAEGKKSATGPIGQVAQFLMWGTLGVGVAIIAKKVFFYKVKKDTRDLVFCINNQ
jgi:hypothetical protein